MNNLEFIERQLIFTQEEERITKKQLEQIPPNEKLRINALKIKLQTIKNNLIQLQQIKSELEAWEVCKQNYHINKYGGGERFDISIWLNTENCSFKGCAKYEDILKVKKALEIEDENL